MSATGKLRVAIVGAGAAGLCVARHVSSRSTTFDPPVVYEITDHVGGTWFYEERVGIHDNGHPVHSSMYRDLRTNLPKEVMMFPDYPFDAQLPSFLSHRDILQYLQKYCKRHAITPYIKFNTVVEEVKPISMETVEGGAVTWEVISRGTYGGQNTQTFDSVFICSGHYSTPHLPSIPGIEHFKGKVMHSHSYRCREPFAHQSVVVLGAGSSGVDISFELVQANAKVTLSHNKPALAFPLPPEIQQAPPVVKVLEDGSLLFQDGSVAHAEVLLFCTGYSFHFPFLCPKQLGLGIQHHLVAPLYKYLLPPAFPSLFFVGICKIICPFIHFHYQVQFALAVLEGTVQLPSRKMMEEAAERERQMKVQKGVQEKHLLQMGSDQWEYYLDLATIAGISPPNPVVESLYEEVGRQRRMNPQAYRQINYKLVGATHWQVLGATDT
ncbi:flavin-containing monooxygenase FMO GS-OX-like 4 [Electrophorus electricus]|uniref:flavin-containing monooxygenase FMO GS-OX-like 4 n=1 Tax=Electrophorus electricus TaxID=8005 RepID=UPI0015D02760|nr:flavin-containing monooxygenase FMO GS-OX-like 4 [Electrophorus electricus]XP_026876751.2 flavin-containing monooxygenase FMO GS-OX-like 4 [Electrophorus electricus]